MDKKVGKFRTEDISDFDTYIDQEVKTTSDVEHNSLSIAADQKISFDGAAKNTYLKFNSSNNRLELYVDGIIKASWG